MALDKTRLKTSIHDKLVAQFGAAKDDDWLLKFCDAVADAVVTEVTGNGIVNGGTVTGTVTSGGGTGGAVTGTIAGATIT